MSSNCETPGEVRFGFENDSFDQVYASLERLLSGDTKPKSLQRLAIGHQQYLQLEHVSTKKKKNTKTEDPPIWNLLMQLRAPKIQRIDFHFHYRITSDKEETRYEKSKFKLQHMTTKLAENLQKNMEKLEDYRQVSVDGTSNRVEEPMEAVVTGTASILFGEAAEE